MYPLPFTIPLFFLFFFHKKTSGIYRTISYSIKLNTVLMDAYLLIKILSQIQILYKTGNFSISLCLLSVHGNKCMLALTAEK